MATALGPLSRLEATVGERASDISLLPLCVDLDGTLVRTDVLVEGLLASGTDWRNVPRAFGALARGRAALKRRIAEQTQLDPALLPYNEVLLTYLRAQKAAGRRLVLATAADHEIAQSVAAHLGIFNEVIASDGKINLKGEAKARRLVDRFGEKGFVYAANSRADLAVWRAAAGAIVVNAPASVARAAQDVASTELVVDNRPPLVVALLRAIRPHQWVKNLLCLVPIVTAHAYHDPTAWSGGALAFAAFCAAASGVYLVNDLSDLAADRAHPRKRRRPFASGSAPITAGLVLAPMLLILGLALGYAANAALIVAAYAATSLLYSAKLKELPLVDVFCLASLYTLRLFAGGEATGHRLSLWLLAFSGFVFLGLALLKRVEELSSVADVDRGSLLRRGYSSRDGATLQIFGCASAFAASLVLALFVQSEATAEQYASPGLLWGAVPLVLFWQCRLWLSTARGYMHDDPIVYAARDWVSWIVAGTLAVLLVLAKSIAFAGW